MIEHMRNLALQDLALCLQKMGKRGLQQCQQTLQPELRGASTSQLEEA